MPIKPRPSPSFSRATRLTPAGKTTEGTAKKSSSTLIIAILFLLLAGGGATYFYIRSEEQKEEAQKEAERIRKDEQARKAAAKAERLRLKAEQEEKAAREKEEKERAEQERLKAEQARKEAEAVKQRAAAQQEEPPAAEETGAQDTPPAEEPEEPKNIYDDQPPLTGDGCNTKEAQARLDALVDQMLDKREFEAFEKAFSVHIKQCMPELISGEKLNYNAYHRNRNLMQAVDLCFLIRTAGESTLSQIANPTETKGEAKDGAESGKIFFQWLLRDKSQPLHSFIQAFAANQGREENMAYHIKTFYTLWSDTPAKERAKYLNLAIACSLVRPGAAQSAGLVRNPKQPILTIRQVYAYFREMDAAKKLLTDIKTLSVTNLLYVVDVRLPRSEFDWVMDNMNYSQEQWGSAYGSIRYLMERATKGKDPYTHYTFAEIRKEGGVCRDQGYFASATAKCKGIPAVYITGDGDRGPHAWIAAMTDKTSWKQTGSYGYTTGRFSNPCSGRVQHESVLLNQTKKTTDDKLQAAYDGMALSAYLSSIGSTAEARGAALYVTNAFPTLTSAWLNRLAVLGHDEENPPTEEQWKKIRNALAQQGRKNPELLDLAADIENDYLMEGKSNAAKKSAMKRSADKLKKTAGADRSDLLLDAIQRQADLLAETKDWRGLARLYKNNLKENTSRGDIFEALLRQYSAILEQAGDDAPASAWATLAKDAESLFNKQVMSGGGDFFKVKKEVSIQKLIAAAYEKTGNPKDRKKAGKILETAEQRLQSATPD